MNDDLLWLTAYAGCVTTIIIFVVSGGILPLQYSAQWIAQEVQTASVFLVPSISAVQIQQQYHEVSVSDPVTGVAMPLPSQRVRIVIVPGHQPTQGGAVFDGVRERDVVVSLAEALAALLAQNPRYDVIVTRTTDAWNPILQTYFDTNGPAIQSFQESLKQYMAQYLTDGSFLPAVDQVYHNTASTDGAQELYGINKWSNENGVAITVHIHLNDDADHRANRAGANSGFAVYIPDYQFANAAASRSVGESIARRLNAYHATSTLPGESSGVVEDQQLIAVGSNNSARDAAVLIEYGYLYEPQFQDAEVRALAVRDYAYATHLGLQDFMKDPVAHSTGSAALPYDWTRVTAKLHEQSADVYALQSALHSLGVYPPQGKSFSDCPISGMMGECTRTALKAYQSSLGLEATGIVGTLTRAALTRDSGQ